MIDLVISSVILIIIMSYVVANIRSAGSNDFKLMLNQLAGDFSQAQARGVAGQLLEVCYLDGVPSGLCQQQTGCSDCRKTYPAGGFGLKISKCAGSPCQYEIFADINGNHQVDNNETIKDLTLGKSYISNLYSTDQAARPAIFSGWSPVVVNAVSVIFDSDGSRVYFDGIKQNSLTYLGLRLVNEKFPGDGYVYFSAATGFSVSGVIGE